MHAYFFPTTFRKNNFLRNGTQAFKVLYFCDYFIQLYLLHAIVGDPSTGYVFVMWFEWRFFSNMPKFYVVHFNID